MLDAMSAIMISMGRSRATDKIVARSMFDPGKAPSAQRIPNAIVAPTGAEKQAVNTAASRNEASRTNPVDLRTNIELLSSIVPAPLMLSRSHEVRESRLPRSTEYTRQAGITPTSWRLLQPLACWHDN